jgi:hypothetical protein
MSLRIAVTQPCMTHVIETYNPLYLRVLPRYSTVGRTQVSFCKGRQTGLYASDSPRRKERGTVTVLCDRLRIAPGPRWVRPFRRSATSSSRSDSQHTRRVGGRRVCCRNGMDEIIVSFQTMSTNYCNNLDNLALVQKGPRRSKKSVSNSRKCCRQFTHNSIDGRSGV